MFKQFGRIETHTDINDFLFTLSSSIKQFNQVNKNIDVITKTDNYLNGLKKFSNDISGLNQVGLLHGLDAFSHIMDLLGFDNPANKLRIKLLENGQSLVDQNIYIICDTYYNFGLLRGDTTKLAQKILQYINQHQTLPESCYQKVVRSLNKRAQFNEYDFEIAQKLDNIDISKFLPETQLKCFRYFAEYNPMFRRPFYGFPQKLSYVTNSINEIPSQSLSDVFYGYLFLGKKFNQDFLHKALNQFNQQVWDTKGVYNQNKFSTYQRTLKIIKHLSFLNQNLVKWDIHLEQFLFLMKNQKSEEDAITGNFCSLFSNKLEEFNNQQRNEIFEVIKNQLTSHNKLPVLEFILNNQKYMDESIKNGILETFSNQKKDQFQKETFENLHYQCFKNIKLNKFRLLTLHYNYFNYEEKTLEYLRQMNMRVSYWGCQFKILLISINGEKTSQFWKSQTQKMKNEIQSEFQLEIERQLNQDYIMYPKVFNYYQLEFIIWALNYLSLLPIKAAPLFYRDIIKHNELIDKIVDSIIQNKLNFFDSTKIWEQMDFCDNKKLVDYLKKLIDLVLDKKIANKLKSL